MSHAECMADFFQNGPTLENQYSSDLFLQNYLSYKLPKKILKEIEPQLVAMGEKAAGEYLQLANTAESESPQHIPYDPWGRRIDKIQISSAWRELEKISAQQGLVAIGYERAQGEFSRIFQFALLYLFHPSSAFFTCPLAMTDGAARALELHADSKLKKRALMHLTSRDPSAFWTSGQWMTERTGGSDVGDTSTVARQIKGEWKLFGTKWFTSATTAQMAMTLARCEGDTAGSRGLSLFYVELRNSSGDLQNIEIHRLKNKLGTKALPTAELTLNGTPAQLIGERGKGVRQISTQFNLTRLYNSICALGAMRRALVLAQDYAKKRKAFGKLLIEQPLQQEVLAKMTVDFEASFIFTFELLHWLGKEEMNNASEEESALLRLLTPVVKLYTAKQAMALTSEMIEAFGGAGYVEDTGLPRLLRDAQVFSIWEGTTNVLSLDLLRALEKDKSLPIFIKDLERRLKGVKKDSEKILRAARALPNALAQINSASPAGARAFAWLIAEIYCGTLLLELAAKSSDAHLSAVATRFCMDREFSLGIFSEDRLAESKSILRY